MLVILVLAGGAYLVVAKPFGSRNPNGIACTTEAKECPDGSYVSRTGPDCAFAVCPSQTQSGIGIKGTVFLGPTCPVERNPPDPQCANKLYQTSLVVTNSDGTHVIKTFSSDANGNFSVQVPPGTYAIRSAPSMNMLPRCSTNGTITVSTGTYASTTVYCDTGIR